jgi:hypothetical protein
MARKLQLGLLIVSMFLVGISQFVPTDPEPAAGGDTPAMLSDGGVPVPN